MRQLLLGLRQGCCRLVSFNPIDNQLANLFARAIDHWGILVHVVPATAVDAIIVGGETKLPRGRQRLATKAQVLNALADGLRDVELVSDAFSDVEVVSGNLFVHSDRVAALPGLVSLEILRRVFQRVFELLAGDFQHRERVFVNVKTGDVAHTHRSFRDPRFRIETRHHRHVRLAGFQLHLSESDRELPCRENARRARLTLPATRQSRATATLRFAIVRLGEFHDFRIGLDAIVSGNRARRLRIHAPTGRLFASTDRRARDGVPSGSPASTARR
jgi:hypothetical protein